MHVVLLSVTYGSNVCLLSLYYQKHLTTTISFRPRVFLHQKGSIINDAQAFRSSESGTHPTPNLKDGRTSLYCQQVLSPPPHPMNMVYISPCNHLYSLTPPQKNTPLAISIQCLYISVNNYIYVTQLLTASRCCPIKGGGFKKGGGLQKTGGNLPPFPPLAKTLLTLCSLWKMLAKVGLSCGCSSQHDVITWYISCGHRSGQPSRSLRTRQSLISHGLSPFHGVSPRV